MSITLRILVIGHFLIGFGATALLSGSGSALAVEKASSTQDKKGIATGGLKYPEDAKLKLAMARAEGQGGAGVQVDHGGRRHGGSARLWVIRITAP